MLTAFFDSLKPHSTMANPACIANTKTAHSNRTRLSIAYELSATLGTVSSSGTSTDSPISDDASVPVLDVTPDSARTGEMAPIQTASTIPIASPMLRTLMFSSR